MGHVDYEGHIILLALMHLEIEHFPKMKFKDDEIFEKVDAFTQNITGKNLHINLTYAATQMNSLEEKAIV
mgnify:CR=1 FL=1